MSIQSDLSGGSYIVRWWHPDLGHRLSRLQVEYVSIYRQGVSAHTWVTWDPSSECYNAIPVVVTSDRRKQGIIKHYAAFCVGHDSCVLCWRNRLGNATLKVAMQKNVHFFPHWPLVNSRRKLVLYGSAMSYWRWGEIQKHFARLYVQIGWRFVIIPSATSQGLWCVEVLQ